MLSVKRSGSASQWSRLNHTFFVAPAVSVSTMYMSKVVIQRTDGNYILPIINGSSSNQIFPKISLQVACAVNFLADQMPVFLKK